MNAINSIIFAVNYKENFAAALCNAYARNEVVLFIVIFVDRKI